MLENVVIVILMVILALWGFNMLMGYRNGNITMDLDDRYTNLKEYVVAVQKELERHGRKVIYQWYRRFLIDGKPYILQEQNVSMGGVPLQHTILKREKV